MMLSTNEPITRPLSFSEVVQHELHHLASHWLWFMLLGGLLVLAGTAAIVIPAATAGTGFAVAIFFGAVLMVAGIATVVSSFWIGKWSGFLIQLLVGILYIGCGFVMTENPFISLVTMTVFVAVSFIMLGIFRSVAALVHRFPHWGWTLLNGAVTMIVGIVIYRQLPYSALWVIGLLVGIEMLFNGWSWLILGWALRKVSRSTATAA